MLVNSIGVIVRPLCRRDENGLFHFLGTCFFISNTGELVTVAHAVGDNDENLFILLNNMHTMNDYQDETDLNAEGYKVKIKDIDTIHDICVLKTNINIESSLKITNSDNLNLGQKLVYWGYPHSNHGRKILTYSEANLGAKVIINTHGLKTKSIILNAQSFFGQSGSPVLNSNNEIVAMVIGSYIPNNYTLGTVLIGGIDPQTLNQTTRAISAEYIGDMLQ